MFWNFRSVIDSTVLIMRDEEGKASWNDLGPNF